MRKMHLLLVKMIKIMSLIMILMIMLLLLLIMMIILLMLNMLLTSCILDPALNTLTPLPIIAANASEGIFVCLFTVLLSFCFCFICLSVFVCLFHCPLFSLTIDDQGCNN